MVHLAYYSGVYAKVLFRLFIFENTKSVVTSVLRTWQRVSTNFIADCVDKNTDTSLRDRLVRKVIPNNVERGDFIQPSRKQKKC